MQNKQKKSRFGKRRILVALIVVVLLAASGIGWKIHRDSQAKNSAVKLSPSAKIEQKIGQQQAEQKGTSGSTTTGSSTIAPKGSDSGGSGTTTQAASGNVTPTITYPTNPPGQESASSVEVDALIPGIEENGGTCTLTLSPASGGAVPVKATSPASLNGQATSCRPFHVPSSSVSAGMWTAVVSYSSSAYQGTSKPVSFTID